MLTIPMIYFLISQGNKRKAGVDGDTSVHGLKFVMVCLEE